MLHIATLLVFQKSISTCYQYLESQKTFFALYALQLLSDTQAFLFNSREIFSIEPQIGLNINSRNRLSETTTFDESSDDTVVISSEDKISNIGIYLKLKLSFYLGRHFWSH